MFSFLREFRVLSLRTPLTLKQSLTALLPVALIAASGPASLVYWRYEEPVIMPVQEHRAADVAEEPTENEESEEHVMGESDQRASAATERMQRAQNAVGMYLTPNSVAREDFFVSTMEDSGEAGANALVFDVKGSAVFFDADAPMAKELGLVQQKYNLSEVLRMAHERGIYTIGRFIAVKDAGFTRARPDTMIAHPTNGRKIGYEFIDPENADALEYNRQVLCALAKSGIDEVNLDYIRFSTEQVGALGAYSMEEKSRKVTTFVKMARAAIDECGPDTLLGVSTYAILGWNYDVNLRTLGQDFVNWVDLVDIISPMAYPATFSVHSYYIPGKSPGSRMYYLVWRTLDGYKELVGEEHAHKIRPWIQGYGVTKQNMADQMKAVTDAGLCGFTVWNANNAYGVTYNALPTFVRPEGCTL